MKIGNYNESNISYAISIVEGRGSTIFKTIDKILLQDAVFKALRTKMKTYCPKSFSHSCIHIFFIFNNQIKKNCYIVLDLLFFNK